MFQLLARSTEYSVLHGMKFLLMSSGNDDTSCKYYPLASAMMMDYARTNNDSFLITPVTNITNKDIEADLDKVLSTVQDDDEIMKINDQYKANIKLKKYSVVSITSLYYLYAILDEHKLLYSSIYNSMRKYTIISTINDAYDEIDHAVVLTSVGKLNNMTGIYAEVVNSWGNAYKCGGVSYIKISEDEQDLKNNMNLFGFNAWIETEYSSSYSDIYKILTIALSVLSGGSISEILISHIGFCRRKKFNDAIVRA